MGLESSVWFVASAFILWHMIELDDMPAANLVTVPVDVEVCSFHSRCCDDVIAS
jgi:hypothetical protein